jgi:ATP-dependent Clp protease ATP-binding subunit ClpA
MNQKPKPLTVIDGETLLDTRLPKRSFCIETLLPEGISMLGGAPKIGKSWMVLDFGVRIAKGEPIWNLPTKQGTVLYLALEDSLSKKVIGQERAIRAVSNAIRRGRTGLCAPNRPTGSFLFLGSTGVGKTELCRALAEELFESPDALLKLDMSEYMEKHNVSKLIGAPPGYVGYGEGGILTERIRRRPYSVILLDEIEKAHPDVLNLLLQIIEDGVLTDGSGRKTYFSNAVIIMTSNLLSHADCSHRVLGFSDGESSEKQDIRQERKLREFFKPEFLNRIDEIVLFEELDVTALTNIARIMIKELRDRAAAVDVNLEISDEVAKYIANKCIKKNRELGARPLRRELTDLVETPLSHLLLCDKSRSVKIYVGQEKILLSPLSSI